MNNRNIFLAVAMTLSSAAMAIEKPTIDALIGTYKGDCKIVQSGEKRTEPTELKIEQDGEKVKITFTFVTLSSTSVTSLKPNVEQIDIDDDSGLTETQLLSITDKEQRKWTITGRTSTVEGIGFDQTEKTELDFSKPSVVKVKAKATLGGEVNFTSSCVLKK